MNIEQLSASSIIIIDKKNINRDKIIKISPKKNIDKNNFPPKKRNDINHFQINNNIYNIYFNNNLNSLENSKKVFIYSKNKSIYTFSEIKRFNGKNKDKNDSIIAKKFNKYHKLNDE